MLKRVIRRAPALAAAVAAAGSLALAAQASADIYWANEESGTIGRAKLDGTGVEQSFIGGAAFPAGVAVDDEHIYWANDGTIGRARLDGTGVEQSFIGGASFPGGVAVDGGHVYWPNTTGANPNTIGRAMLDGTGVEQSFISGAITPFGVAVDGEHIYWAVNGGTAIGRAKLDGTGVEQSFITGASFPGGVAVDGEHIYWTNLGTGTIGRAKLDGTGVEQSFISGALPGAVAPAGVAIVGEHIYWANDVEEGSIGRANLDGTGVEKSFITGASSPAGVAVDAHTVTVSTSGQGTVTSSPAGIECGEGCSHPFAAGTAVTLTATPEFGWILSGWSGGACSGTSPTCELTMDSDQTITASFVPGIFLIIHKDGTGSGTVTSSPAGIECGTSCQGLFATMTAVTLTATPDPGSLFTAWSGGGCVGSSPTCEITPNTDWDIFATFNTARTLTVDVSGNGAGTVTSSPAGIECGTSCSHEFEDGSVVQLKATPSPGSRFTGWSGGGCSTASPTCEVPLDADRRVSASFARPAPPGPPKHSRVAGPPPSNQFSFAGLRRNRSRGTARLKILVPAPGMLRLAKRGLVRRSIRRAPGAGTVPMLVRPTKRARKLLRRLGRTRVTATVTFTPTGGEPSTKRRRLTLVRK